MEVTAVTPELLLHAYASGIFPMADSREDEEIFWVDPEERGIIDLRHFHISRSLRKTVRRDPFQIRIDSDFRGVMAGCAEAAAGRESTWISTGIEDLYCELQEAGSAHSVECWHDKELIGGLYGVSLRQGFFGESMFHRATDASKVALVHLVARLIVQGYHLLDVQFQTEHLQQFGVKEIPRHEYRVHLHQAMQGEATLTGVRSMSGEEALRIIDDYSAGALQPTTHTS